MDEKNTTTVRLEGRIDSGNAAKVEEAILNHSRRLVVEKDADLSLLLSMDFDLSDVEG